MNNNSGIELRYTREDEVVIMTSHADLSTPEMVDLLKRFMLAIGYQPVSVYRALNEAK